MILESVSELLMGLAGFMSWPNGSNDDPDISWAKLLVPIVKRMTQAVADTYKVHVDSIK